MLEVVEKWDVIEGLSTWEAEKTGGAEEISE